MRSLLPSGMSILMMTMLIAVVTDPTTTQTTLAQRVEIASSLNPVGSGARALGMGGAYIAVADDATAASWNPGGLIQLERPEIAIVGAGMHRAKDNAFGHNPEAEGVQQVDKIDLNYFSAAYPFTIKDYNMIVAINYQKLYNFFRKWQLNLDHQGANYREQEKLDYQQSGDLSALGLACSLQVNPRFSIGLTLNFWTDAVYANGWQEQTNQAGSGIYDGHYGVFDLRRTDTYDFSGINATFGLLWQAFARLTLGAVLKSPFTADLNLTRSRYYAFYFPADQANQPTVTQTHEKLSLAMPLSYGIGAAYRFSDAFSLSMDLYRTHWNDFELTDQAGQGLSPITGKASAETNDPGTPGRRVPAFFSKKVNNGEQIT